MCDNKTEEKKLPKLLFGGSYYENDEPVYIEKVIYNNPYTIVFFNDVSKTTCKCNELDKYDKEKGLLICFMKRVFGSQEVIDLFDDWTGPENIRTLKHVRTRRKGK